MIHLMIKIVSFLKRGKHCMGRISVLPCCFEHSNKRVHDFFTGWDDFLRWKNKTSVSSVTKFVDVNHW